MAILGKYTKQPRETETYTISYADDLTDGDEVVSSSGAIAPQGDPEDMELMSVNHDGTSVRVWLRKGRDRVRYKIEVTATTGDGRILQDEFYVTGKEY